MTEAAETIHATCVAIRGAGVLIAGASGAGKSDLALRLLARGAMLVADDYTLLSTVDGRLIASVPATIAGMIEVRGLGLVAMPYRDAVPVALLVALGGAVERLPERLGERRIAGLAVPVLPLAGFEASAPIKLELALERLSREEAR